MIRLEDELKSALQREEPSADFAARVLAQVEALKQGPRSFRASWRTKLLGFFAAPRLRWGIVSAAMIISLLIGGWQYRSYRQTQREGELAKEQVMLAFRIASAKLGVARKKVQENGRRQTGAEPSDDVQKE